MPENVVPKVRVELTQGHPYRFLSALPWLARKDHKFRKWPNFQSLLSHRLGHILDHLSDNSPKRKFTILLCSKSHHYAIVVRVVSVMVHDGYLIVLIQHF